MAIKVGDTLPAGALSEFIEVEGNGCTIGPNEFKVDDLVKGRKVVIFGLPGAFTPTCSAKHVPGYVQKRDQLKAKGVDDVLCMSVNDAFVMGAWARDQKAGGKVRMMGDGSATYTKALGPS
jgi:peroxiredoxin